MVAWNNLDTLGSYKELEKKEKVVLKDVMSGDSGADRVKKYTMPMAAGLNYNYAAKAVNDDIIDGLAKLAE